MWDARNMAAVIDLPMLVGKDEIFGRNTPTKLDSSRQLFLEVARPEKAKPARKQKFNVK